MKQTAALASLMERVSELHAKAGLLEIAIGLSADAVSTRSSLPFAEQNCDLATSLYRYGVLAERLGQTENAYLAYRRSLCIFMDSVGEAHAATQAVLIAFETLKEKLVQLHFQPEV